MWVLSECEICGLIDCIGVVGLCYEFDSFVGGRI